jgi:HK97 family phage major capsid protein
MANESLTKLQGSRAEKVSAMKAILTKSEEENRDLLEAEATAFDELKAEVEALTKRIERLLEIDKLKSSNTQPTAHKSTVEDEFEDTGEKAGRIEMPAKKIVREKGEAAARMIRCMAASKGDPWRAAQIAEKKFNDLEIAKALAASDAASGGFLVPEQYSSEVIELLRPESVVRRANPMMATLANGSVTLPKITGGATAQFIGENQNAPKTQPSFGQLKLTARKLAALVPISNDLIRYGNPSADSIVRDDLIAAMAVREDAAFLRDSGISGTPVGMRYLAPTENVITANATVNLDNVTVDLGKLSLALKVANVRFRRPAVFMAPRSEQYLMDVRDGNGNYAFRAEMNNGTLRRIPYFVSNQIPTNLGSGDDSEIYLVDMADFVVADALNVVLDTSTEAAYMDGSEMKAAFSLDQTVIRAIHEVDCGARHDASIAVLSGVTWGA